MRILKLLNGNFSVVIFVKIKLPLRFLDLQYYVDDVYIKPFVTIVYILSSQNGATALYVSSQNGHVEVVNILLQNGAHVDVQDEVSWTFLHITDRALKL